MEPVSIFRLGFGDCLTRLLVTQFQTIHQLPTAGDRVGKIEHFFKKSVEKYRCPRQRVDFSFSWWC